MSLIKKYVLLFSAFGLIFIISSFAVFLYYFNRSTEEEIFDDIRHHLDIISINVDEMLKNEIDMAVYFASRSNLVEYLMADNERYSSMDPEERTTLIESRNARWIDSGEDDSFVHSIMENELSKNLSSITDVLSDRYGEIFVTNKYGAVIGCTSKLTTYNHDYKNWWQKAYKDGEGEIFIDDRGYDESAGTYVLGVVIPVRYNNEIIGLLKCNVNMWRLIDKLKIYESALGKSWQIILARSKGDIIYKNNAEPLSGELCDEILTHFKAEPDSVLWITEGKERRLYIYSSIPATFKNDKYDFGGTEQTADHSAGNSEEHWCVYASISAKDLRTRIASYQRIFIILAFAFTIICVVTAIIIGRSLTRNIKEIIYGVNEIKKGNLDYTINYVKTDELGLIAKSINNMSNQLKTTLVSRDRLQEMVEEKQQLLLEFNHRVKNNLMLVSSLISLKEMAAADSVDLSDVKQQIEAVKLTQEMLMDSEDIYNINMGDYLKKLLSSIFRSNTDTISTELMIEVNELDVARGKTIGLIVNETATNTIKYSGHAENPVTFSVELKKSDNAEYLLLIKNTGVPLPPETTLDNPGTLGLKLISALVSQLHGRVELERSPVPVFRILFPEKDE